ncbi:MAG: histidine triad nucleotide-binding protein [Actinomycetota bacterium]|nr:histidine triad nucleotide-binding protein [Actinomycetota bacterium]MDD5665826.1 histidine triad nucleotide-binding protein [Actinomycetota bacterium]
MEDCLFCRIAGGEMETEFLHADDEVVAFRDIHPQAPVHFLVVPVKHIVSVLDLTAADAGLLSRVFEVIREVAEKEGIAATGMRILTNVGRDAEQIVQHLHFHVLGGRRLHWPPG